MRRRVSLGAFSTDAASTRAYTDNPREYINRYFPPGSILAEPVSPPLKRGKLSQALFDIGAVLAALLLIVVTGSGIAFSLAALFLVRF
jgi:hypothetical protein